MGVQTCRHSEIITNKPVLMQEKVSKPHSPVPVIRNGGPFCQAEGRGKLKLLKQPIECLTKARLRST